MMMKEGPMKTRTAGSPLILKFRLSRMIYLKLLFIDMMHRRLCRNT